jgi:hypothetical protein
VELPVERLVPIQSADACSVFVPEGPVENPPLQSPKLREKAELLDMGGAFLSRADSLKHFSRFAAVCFLCLRGCGLLSVPPELETPQRSIRFLDLSRNLLAQIPMFIVWSRLKGLNLSENAFAEWPEAVGPDSLPKLGYLSLAFNLIGDPLPSRTGFTRLRLLDLSHTKITMIPSWAGESRNLRVLRLAGNSGMKPLHRELLTTFKSLAMADVTGVEMAGPLRQIAVPSEMLLIVMKGAARP